MFFLPRYFFLCFINQLLLFSLVDNTKTVIYIWSAAVFGLILMMIGFIIFYRHRKIEKGYVIILYVFLTSLTGPKRAETEAVSLSREFQKHTIIKWGLYLDYFRSPAQIYFFFHKRILELKSFKSRPCKQE